MTLNEWILETEMFQYSKENYEMTRIIGSIELTELAINSYQSILLVDESCLEYVNPIITSDILLVEAEKSFATMVKNAWDWIITQLKKCVDAICSFFRGSKKKANKSIDRKKAARENIDTLSEHVPQLTPPKDSIKKEVEALYIQLKNSISIDKLSVNDPKKSLKSDGLRRCLSYFNISDSKSDIDKIYSIIDDNDLYGFEIPAASKELHGLLNNFISILDKPTINNASVKTLISKIDKLSSSNKSTVVSNKEMNDIGNLLEEIKSTIGEKLTSVADRALTSETLDKLKTAETVLVELMSHIVKESSTAIQHLESNIDSVSAFVKSMKTTASKAGGVRF